MKNRKGKGGVSSTKDVRSTVGNKHILSNRNTGNKRSYNSNSKLKGLSAEAQARFRRIKEVLAEKSKFISPEEFEGDGKILDILDVDPEAQGKYGPVVQFAVREPKTNRDRVWNVSSIRALRAVDPLLEVGERLLRVWTTGTGTDKLYHAEAVTGIGSGAAGYGGGQKKRKETKTRRR